MTKHPRIIVCGSRDWTDKAHIWLHLEKLTPHCLVAHGDNGYDELGHALWGEPDWKAVKGADKLAGDVAKKLGHRVVPFTPRWRLEGRGAGFIRNEEMLATIEPHLVLAFRLGGVKSNGTDHMIEIARAAGVETRVTYDK